MLVLKNEMQVQSFLVIKLGRKLSFYDTSNSHECMGVNGEVLQLHVVYKKPYFLLQVTRESLSVLQVTRESVSVLQVTRESVSVVQVTRESVSVVQVT